MSLLKPEGGVEACKRVFFVYSGCWGPGIKPPILRHAHGGLVSDPLLQLVSEWEQLQRPSHSLGSHSSLFFSSPHPAHGKLEILFEQLIIDFEIVAKEAT